MHLCENEREVKTYIVFAKDELLIAKAFSFFFFFGKKINMTFNFLQLEQSFLTCCGSGHQPSDCGSVYQDLHSNFFGYKAKYFSACCLPVGFLIVWSFSWNVLTWEICLLVRCLLWNNAEDFSEHLRCFCVGHGKKLPLFCTITHKTKSILLSAKLYWHKGFLSFEA